MNPNEIARQMDKKPTITLLTYNEAVNKLKERAIKGSNDGILTGAMWANWGITDFANGNVTLGELKDCVDVLVETANDTLDLACAIADAPAIDAPEFGANEFIPLESIDYLNTTYRLIDAINEWKDINTIINEALKLSILSHDLYQSVALFENNVGGHYEVDPVVKVEAKDAAEFFDRTLLETVSTGAIAIRPAALPVTKTPFSHGGMRRHGALPKKKKKYWYEKYAIQQ